MHLNAIIYFQMKSWLSIHLSLDDRFSHMSPPSFSSVNALLLLCSFSPKLCHFKQNANLVMSVWRRANSWWSNVLYVMEWFSISTVKKKKRKTVIYGLVWTYQQIDEFQLKKLDLFKNVHTQSQPIRPVSQKSLGQVITGWFIFFFDKIFCHVSNQTWRAMSHMAQLISPIWLKRSLSESQHIIIFSILLHLVISESQQLATQHHLWIIPSLSDSIALVLGIISISSSLDSSPLGFDSSLILRESLIFSQSRDFSQLWNLQSDSHTKAFSIICVPITNRGP